ncbi:MAG: type II toxin-antitoxin system RelE/ParE family toxin [Hyphomicrobiales bacterium]|nr:type II toxin-antitoxin system RelE/ParE family toxin [Hyphomicrobiales bacterium]MDE2115149.1 type II toxin-antitoxin system RelE/ParE family toxin [Hyphomicrobiales bacterium]
MIEVRKTSTFLQWLTALRDQRAVARIQIRIDRVLLGNFGDVKAVGEGVCEMKIDYGPGYRVYYVQRGKTLVLLLCGGDKSTQKSDIAEAKSLSREWTDGS